MRIDDVEKRAPVGWPAGLAILLGIALRLWQYLANPSLWVDEAAVARNVLDRSAAHLFGPLDYGQVAPPGFLLGVKLSTLLFGGTEYALRLVPLLAGLAGPILLYRVAREILRPIGTIVATLLFSLAVPLIFFSANLKQYSSDVAVTLLVLAAALRIARSVFTPRSACGYALLFATLLFGSQTAVFATTAAGAALLVEAFAKRRPDRRLRLALVAGWAALVLASAFYGRSLLTPADDAYLHRFWSSGFMPRHGALAWLWIAVRNVFAGPPVRLAFDGSLHYAVPVLFVALFGIGAVALVRRSSLHGALVVGPIGLALLASAAQAFPWNPRLGLCLLPLFLLGIVAGAESVTSIGRWSSLRLAPLLLVPFGAAALLDQPPPWTPEHLRPVMQQIRARWRPGDVLWVYYGAGQAFDYYAREIPLAGEVRLATCDRADPRDLLRQVDAERGRSRVWILMAHGSGPFGFDERGMLLAYLETIGRRLDRFHAPPGDETPNRAEAALFDLSDPARLAATTAERFPLGDIPAPRTWTCYGTMSPGGPAARVMTALPGGE